MLGGRRVRDLRKGSKKCKSAKNHANGVKP